MSLILTHLDQDVAAITAFLQACFKDQQRDKAVIAVSGGIDSAVALTLLTHALGAENVYPILLPHHLQPMDDAQEMIAFNQIDDTQVTTIDIAPVVARLAQELGVTETEPVRMGNLKARTRMIMVYDLAKKLDGLVCGTENKSERYLGYFTRFGDAASDIEPLSHLYKTQVRQVAEYLQLPAAIIVKPPSAGLWVGQSDETELGFSYREADLVLHRLVDLGQSVDQIRIPGLSQETIAKVVTRVEQMHFKQEVPYTMINLKGAA